MPERNCGICGQTMKNGRYGPLLLDFCGPCDGVWFDCGELGTLIAGGPQVVARLVELLSKQAGGGKTGVERPWCPTCRCMLDGVDYPDMPGLRLDRCAFCEGYWLSRGDLNDLSVGLGGGSIFEAETRRHSVQNRAEKEMAAAAAAVTPAPPPPDSPSISRAGDMTPCPKCGQRNGLTAPSCWACAAPLHAPVVARCPRCEASMREVDSAGVGIAFCEGCGAAWTTPQRLNRLLLQAEPQKAEFLGKTRKLRPELRKKLHPELRCPRDGQLLKPARLGVILAEPVPACPKCYGVVLLPGMLDQALGG